MVVYTVSVGYHISYQSDNKRCMTLVCQNGLGMRHYDELSKVITIFTISSNQCDPVEGS